MISVIIVPGNVIEVKNLRKRFGQQEILADVSFTAKAGEIIALFGPNGCGKTTILNILSGLVEHDKGHFKVEKFNPSEFSYVFQSYRDSLLPWRSAYSNIAFPLELRGETKETIGNRIHEIKEICDFNLNLELLPCELSGGQQQIIAFIRALVSKPKLLFIDEPFSALDYDNNLQFRETLQKFYVKFKPTVVIITHDIEEAVHLAGKIIVLSKHPAKVIEILENREKYPRGTSFLKSEQFHKIQSKVLDAFQKSACP